MNTVDDTIASLERRVKELEMCCERLKVLVDELDKRKADRTFERPPVYFHPSEVPHFEGDRDELTGQHR
ncbi:MAG: hypothetical protein ACXV5F_02755 [Halobacteriota archaeon]